MKCPVDGTTLVLTERHGVEVDYCPECERMWLDHCETDGWAGQADHSRHNHHCGVRKHHSGRARGNSNRSQADIDSDAGNEASYRPRDDSDWRRHDHRVS